MKYCNGRKNLLDAKKDAPDEYELQYNLVLVFNIFVGNHSKFNN